jgi:ferric-dicitrate binding protein FerR (iron transport regulator)
MNKPDEDLINKFIENRCIEQEYNQMMSYLYSLSVKELDIFMDSHIKKNEEEDFETNAEYTPNFTGLLLQMSKERKRRFTFSRRVYSVAASIAFLLILSTVVLYFTHTFNSKHDGTKWKEMQTVMGQKIKFNFLDGTSITLNADSKLKYPESFQKANRDVYLEGEAYFEVAHDTNKPFIVHCKNISTTVLGTKFNVSAYPNEKEIAISLIEGKVNVSDNQLDNDKKLAILKPKQQFLYSTAKKTYHIKQFDKDEIIGWKDNLLKFNAEPLSEVLIRLERAYGVKFELAPKHFRNYLITTNFQKGTLSEVSEVIKKLTGLNDTTINENDKTEKIVFY